MAYSLACRIGAYDSDGHPVRLSLPDGRLFERRLGKPDLARLIGFDFESKPKAVEAFGRDLFNMLFAGAESLLNEAVARGAADANPLTRVLLEITSTQLEYLPWELAGLGIAGDRALEIVRSIPVAPKLASQIPTLPFRVLVANMGDPHEDTPTFPLRTVLLNIFRDPERLTKVFRPTTMAGVGRDELAGVLAQSRYEIVHLQVLTEWRHDTPSSRGVVVAPGDGPLLDAGTLLALLTRAQTRLLILHLRHKPYRPPEAAQLFDLARGLVAEGGPAVLIVPFDPIDPAGGTVMLNRLYEQIVHDQPLDAALHWARAAVPDAEFTAGRPVLFLGQGAEDLVRVSPLATDLLQQTSRIRTRMAHLSNRLDQLSFQDTGDLSRANDLRAKSSEALDRSERIARDIKSWDREIRGLMPLHDATEEAKAGQLQLESFESEIEKIEERVARVVNLCFLRGRGRVSGLETLLHKEPYELRLQIGPPWGDRSIVRNARELPEAYLEAHSDDTGIDLDVCIYSEDFSLPDGDIFPLRLRRAPAISNHLDIAVIPEKLGTARLRACVYYRQNLIQSLAVVASVSEERVESRDGANYATIEFSMADTVLGVEELPERTLSLLTNDSADGTHKIAIRGADIKLQYTLTGSTAITDIRKTLLAICADVDSEGNPTGYHYSDDDNSGDEAKLIADLKALATVGEKLYTDLIIDPANWDEQDPLEQKLKQPGQIQIAITSSARNVYPWAMVYDRKLESGPGIKVCPVMLKKLTGADQADKLHANSCIDGGCAHADDIKMICPLGFWGFRHAIEQLPPNQGTIVSTITAPRPPSFVMAVHQKLAGKEHCAEIEKAAGLTAKYVDLKKDIGAALKSSRPHVVYFYCHGGHSDNTPWLGVGNEERIAPGDLRAWDTRWKDTTPLVVINGCHTVDLNPDDLLDFVKIFAWCRALGVIGTEIAIPESLAQEFGCFFFTRFAKGEKVAIIFRDFRLTLLAKRNLLGLSYTPYGNGDLHLVLS